jgi:hypothetical protein
VQALDKNEHADTEIEQQARRDHQQLIAIMEAAREAAAQTAVVEPPTTAMSEATATITRYPPTP